MPVDLILVPQGAEYSAVTRGLKASGSLNANRPDVWAIPFGIKALNYLERVSLMRENERVPLWNGKNILLMGLGGSLSGQCKPGDIVLPKSLKVGVDSACCYSGDILPEDGGDVNGVERSSVYPSAQQIWSVDVFEPSLIQALYQTLIHTLSDLPCPPKIVIAHGVTSDRIITTALEKQWLGRAYDAAVVDMEGAHIVDFFQHRGAQVGIVRVISDGSETDIPELNVAIDEEGSLNFGAMIWQFFQQPVAAAHLVQGSLKGLKRLERIAACCAFLDV